MCTVCFNCVFFFKQKTAYEMRISDWSSDVCSSDPIVQGGTALNIVPKDCHFDFEFRHIAEDDPQALFDEVKSFAEERLLPEMRKKIGRAVWRERECKSV